MAMNNRLDHVAVAVRSIEEALPFYRDLLGFVFEGEERVLEQQVRVAVLRAGGTRIELLEPLSPASPVARFLEKKGEGLHHVAVAVERIEELLDRLSLRQVPLIDEKAREGAGGTKIAFIHPAAGRGVLVELVERPSPR